LADLYKATGQPDWLGLARESMQIAEIASDFLFRTLRAGKVGWAAAVPFTLTGDSHFRDMGIRVGDNILSCQTQTGTWMPSGMSSNDATAEMVVWLDEIHQARSPLNNQRKAVWEIPPPSFLPSFLLLLPRNAESRALLLPSRPDPLQYCLISRIVRSGPTGPSHMSQSRW
jgi:hypothetical protein